MNLSLKIMSIAAVTLGISFSMPNQEQGLENNSTNGVKSEMIAPEMVELQLYRLEKKINNLQTEAEKDQRRKIWAIPLPIGVLTGTASAILAKSFKSDLKPENVWLFFTIPAITSMLVSLDCISYTGKQKEIRQQIESLTKEYNNLKKELIDSIS